MTVRIRPADHSDAAALAALAAVTFPLACPPTTTPESIADFISRNLTAERFAEYLADPTRTLFVAIPDAATRPPRHPRRTARRPRWR